MLRGPAWKNIRPTEKRKWPQPQRLGSLSMYQSFAWCDSARLDESGSTCGSEKITLNRATKLTRSLCARHVAAVWPKNISLANLEWSGLPQTSGGRVGMSVRILDWIDRNRVSCSRFGST